MNADDDGVLLVAHWVDSAGNEFSEIGVDDARANQLAGVHSGLKLSPLTAFLGAKWGLVRMIAPSTNYGDFRVGFIKNANRYVVLSTYFLPPEKCVPVQGTRGTPCVDFRVDLSLPLAVLDSVLKDAVRSQRELAVNRGDVVAPAKRAVRKALYAEYLRILDGLFEGEKASEIGAVLDPKKGNDSRIRERDKRYNAAAKEANRLMSGGYKVLPVLESNMGKTVPKK